MGPTCLCLGAGGAATGARGPGEANSPAAHSLEAFAAAVRAHAEAAGVVHLAMHSRAGALVTSWRHHLLAVAEPSDPIPCYPTPSLPPALPAPPVHGVLTPATCDHCDCIPSNILIDRQRPRF